MSTSSASSHVKGHRHRALSLASARSRDEARLGVTTEYRDLSLHSAAANGNLGLVQYALSHGQPVNSVLNGVLPIHAAASSGNEAIVRMLIEAGADVNSPRLSRRYTREGSKSSGISVGSQGSTPLHFAAANGHVAVLNLLISYGADPRMPEKHGLTPAQMAFTNGHRDASSLLQTWSAHLDEADANRDEVASRASVRSSLSMTRRTRNGTATGGVHPQRSFDALASKLAHASHAAPLHALGLGSSSSLHSLASLASSATGNSPALGGSSASPASSQISLGAVSVGSAHSAQTRRGSFTARQDGSAAGSSTRRPSLPSVWEKAAHPRAALRQAFGRGGPGNANLSAAGLSLVDGPALWDEDEDDERSAGGAEYAERKRSLEANRPLRHELWQGAAAERAMEPIADADGGEEVDDGGVPTPVQTRAPPLPVVPPQPPPPVGTLARASSHHFYRPRRSSMLSRSLVSERRPSFEADGDEAGSSFFHDDVTPPPSGANSPPTSPRRPRAVSNPNPQSGTRSPLLQQVQLSHQQHQHLQHLQRAREDSASAVSSSRTSSGGAGAGAEPSPTATADGDGSESGASRPPRPQPSSDVRRAFLDPSASLLLNATAAHNRAPSNSASTDGSTPARFSSSPTSTHSGPALSTYSYTPSTSTAPTSVAPSSPGPPAANRHRRAKEAGVTAVPVTEHGRYLAPVYELRAAQHNVATSEDEEPKTQAQARSRVQRAERELLASAAEAGSSRSSGSASASGRGSGGATSQRSLKDQLAAYGKSLKAERELVEREERERRAKRDGAAARTEQGYTFETISKSSGATPARSASHTPTPSTAPSWRAIPPIDRLVPPPAVVAGRRSVSPSTSSSATPRRRSHDLDAAAPAVSKTTPPRFPALETAPVRAASPTLTRSGSSKSTSTTGATATAAVPLPAVLGQGHGGVSFVGVGVKPSPSSSAAATAAGASEGQPRTSRSDKSHSERGSATAGPPIKTRDQVEEDRREMARLEQRVPHAVRTVPSRRKGLKRWFGAGPTEGGGAPK